MFIFLTNYIYPIKKEITFSNYYNIYLDNPNSEDELNSVKEIIRNTWDLSDTSKAMVDRRLPMETETDLDIVTYERIIEDFLKKFYPDNDHKKYINKIHGNKEEIIDFFAKNWVVVRYENEELITEIKDMNSTELEDGGFFLLEDTHPFEVRAAITKKFCSIVSLLSSSEEYFGWDLLINNSSYEIENSSSNIYINSTIMNILSSIYSKKDDPCSVEYDFDIFLKKINPILKKIDEGLESGEIENKKFLYIGEVLNTSKPQGNLYSSLVRLVGIIELLLTHQPDYNRFNVENSISKQFVLKTSVLMHIHNPKKDLKEARKELKNLYQQRSNIVHGNFNKLDKFLKEIREKDDYFDSLVQSSYEYVRLCILYYIEDTDFIEHLKEN
jgi:hypothetical protein